MAFAGRQFWRIFAPDQVQELLGQVLDGDFIVAGRAMLSDSASDDIRHGVIGVALDMP